MIFNWGKKVNSKNSHDEDEMTMEEILASIRRYVSEEESEPKTHLRHEEDEEESVYKKAKKTETPTLRKEPLEMDITTKTSKGTRTSSIPKIEPRTLNTNQDIYLNQEEKHPYEEEQEQEEELTAQSTISASAAALSRLMEATKSTKAIRESSTGLTLDQLIAELTKPMVKDWLDRNLPSLVEKLVSQEIQKMTKQLMGGE